MSTDSHAESNSRRIAAYSFLAVFANDGTIDEGELNLIEKLALEDGKVDDDEKKVLANIFSRVNKETVADAVWEEILSFRDKYDI